jgi:hypothetical protein
MTARDVVDACIDASDEVNRLGRDAVDLAYATPKCGHE